MKRITNAQITGTLVATLDLDPLQALAAQMLEQAEHVVATLPPDALAAIGSLGYTRADLIGWAVQEAGTRTMEEWEEAHA